MVVNWLKDLCIYTDLPSFAPHVQFLPSLKCWPSNRTCSSANKAVKLPGGGRTDRQDTSGQWHWLTDLSVSRPEADLSLIDDSRADESHLKDSLQERPVINIFPCSPAASSAVARFCLPPRKHPHRKGFFFLFLFPICAVIGAVQALCCHGG